MSVNPEHPGPPELAAALDRERSWAGDGLIAGLPIDTPLSPPSEGTARLLAEIRRIAEGSDGP